MINKKCPKCGSRRFNIEDVYSVVYIFHADEGKVYADGMDDDGGRHIKTICYCLNCQYTWHPRNMNFTIDKDETF